VQSFKWMSYGIVLVALGACAEILPSEEAGLEEEEILVEELFDQIPNNVPFPNPHGFSAAATPLGYVALDNAFFTPQGTNGRHCGTCHAPENGWGMNPGTVTLLFVLTDGTHPIFVNNLDTDTPTCDMSTIEARWNCTTMLRQGKFTRRINMPNTATREFDMTAFDDPFGVTTASTLWFFRRVLPTHTFKTHVTNWDNSNGANNSVRDGLRTQARGNIAGAQQGPSLTIDDPIVQEIADYQLILGHAQTYVWGAGSTTAEGAKGGPLNAVNQPLVDARFDLFDSWQNSSNSRRRAIYRGQQLFNTKTRPGGGGPCRACHNAANHGGNVNSTMFDIGASDVEFAKPDMAIFTLTSRLDGTVVDTTDPGRAIRSGRMSDMNRFDTPTLRGLAARAPYFHNGIARDIAAVVDHYEAALGFDFTDAEEADLVAFLSAL
jgi:cytochrome c peroxidase